MSGAPNDAGGAPEAAVEQRYRKLPRAWRALLIVVTLASILLALNQLLNLGFFVGKGLLGTAYLYWLCALLTGSVFILVPANKRARRDGVPWYDAALYFATVAVFAYYALHAHRILTEGWEFAAPKTAIWVAYAGWLLLLEATRRAGGTAVFPVVAAGSLQPVYAGHMPGPMAGLPQDRPITAD